MSRSIAKINVATSLRDTDNRAVFLQKLSMLLFLRFPFSVHLLAG